MMLRKARNNLNVVLPELIGTIRNMLFKNFKHYQNVSGHYAVVIVLCLWEINNIESFQKTIMLNSNIFNVSTFQIVNVKFCVAATGYISIKIPKKLIFLLQ